MRGVYMVKPVVISLRVEIQHPLFSKRIMASTAADTALNEAVLKRDVQKAVVAKFAEMLKLAREELKERDAEVKAAKEKKKVALAAKKAEEKAAKEKKKAALAAKKEKEKAAKEKKKAKEKAAKEKKKASLAGKKKKAPKKPEPKFKRPRGPTPKSSKYEGEKKWWDEENGGWKEPVKPESDSDSDSDSYSESDSESDSGSEEESGGDM